MARVLTKFDKVSFGIFLLVIALVFLLAFAPKITAAATDTIPVICRDGVCTARAYAAAGAEKVLFCNSWIFGRTDAHPDMLVVYVGYEIDNRPDFMNSSFISARTRSGRTIPVRDIETVRVLSGGRILCEAQVVLN
jgi:hypothetical protein